MLTNEQIKELKEEKYEIDNKIYELRELKSKAKDANNINECIKHGGVTTAVKAVDTILICDNNKIVNVPVRDTMFHAQTPQTFKAKDLYELIKKEDDLSLFTDLCGLYLKHNKEVYIVNGVQNNFKITTREDLDCANNILI